ncbi:MAG: phosphotransferase [Anaerolineae bacterium]
MEFSPIARPADDFQQGITVDELTAVCRYAFGTQTRVVSARELGSGLFNSTYLLCLGNSEQVILRVSPHPQADVFTHEQNLLRREQALEPYLGAVGHLIPRTLATDFSRQRLDRDVAFQTFLPGELWDAVQNELSEAEQSALWCQLAAIAKQIHASQGTGFGFPDGQPSFDRWSTAVAHITHIMRQDLIARGLDIDRTQSPPRIVGLLDAERGLWGDPLAEWIFYFLDIPPAFWEVYGRPPDDPATQFRQLAYRGMYIIQVLLEASRFGWETSGLWDTLAQVNQGMAAFS